MNDIIYKDSKNNEVVSGSSDIKYHDSYMYNKITDKFAEKWFVDTFKIHDLSNTEEIITEQSPTGVMINDEKTGQEKEQMKKTKHQGYTLKGNDRKTYFFTVIDSDGTRTDPRDEFPIKILETRQIIFRNKVFHLVIDYMSGKLPPEKTMKMFEWFDRVNPIKHSSEDDKIIARANTLAAMFYKTSSRLETQAGFGKDSDTTQIGNLTNFGRKVEKATPAKLAQLASEEYTAFNEISGFGGDDRDIFNTFFKTVGDDNPIYEHKSTGSDKTTSRVDIRHYGLNIFHNRLEWYLKRGMKVFENMFDPAVFNRYMPYSLNGVIEKDNQYKEMKGRNLVELFNEAEPFLKSFAKMFYWLKEQSKEWTLSYNIDRYDLEYPNCTETLTRWQNSFDYMAIVLEQYVTSKYPNDSEKEFYRLMDIAYDRHKIYMAKVRRESLLE